MKRVFDFVIALCGTVLLAPVFLITAVVVKLDSPGPVFFRQERVGRRGERFRIFKFRTMVTNKTGWGRRFTILGDKRVTRVGRWLRDCKLDELPQLFNVIKGEMSLVGPRPEVPEFVDLFWEEFEPILQARPGITHEASILFRHEEAILSTVSDPDRFYRETIMPRKLEIYTRSMDQESLASDVKTILDTVLSVVKSVTPEPESVQPVTPQAIALGQVESEPAQARQRGSEPSCKPFIPVRRRIVPERRRRVRVEHASV